MNPNMIMEEGIDEGNLIIRWNGKEVSVTTLMSMFIKNILEFVEEKKKRTIAYVSICVPAYFPIIQRMATVEACMFFFVYIFELIFLF